MNNEFNRIRDYFIGRYVNEKLKIKPVSSCLNSYSFYFENKVVIKCYRTQNTIGIALSKAYINKINEIDYIKPYSEAVTFSGRGNQPFEAYIIYTSQDNCITQSPHYDEIIGICDKYINDALIPGCHPQTTTADQTTHTNSKINSSIHIDKDGAYFHPDGIIASDIPEIDNNELLINSCVLDAFREIIQQACHERTGRLIWPIYSPVLNDGSGLLRISEQELKHQFINAAQSKFPTPYKFSVETPTIDAYKFNKKPRICGRDHRGTSARFDLTIYTNHSVNGSTHTFDILSHVEFKQGNGVDHDIIKDLLKLANEPYCPEIQNEEDRRKIAQSYTNNLKSKNHYFIHLIDSFSKSTFESLNKKYFGLNGRFIFNASPSDNESPINNETDLEENSNEINNFSSEDLEEIPTDEHDENSYNVHDTIHRCLTISNNTIYIYVLIMRDTYTNHGNPTIFRINYNDGLRRFISGERVNLNDIWKRIL